MVNVKVENFKSTHFRSSANIANQFKITTTEGVYFQSYETVIAFRPYQGKIQLDRSSWDYSTTTGKYRNQFLGEGIKATRAKIKSGEYLLTDLN